MDIANITIWLAMTFVITAIITKAARGRISSVPVCNRPLPPVVTGGSMIELAHTLLTKGLKAMIHDQYTKLGSVFTVRFLGTKVTFLVGPEVSSHFFQGSDSEIGHGKILEFTVPMFGKEVGHGVDVTVRNEQNRFVSDALKPSKLRCHVGPMLQEVEVS
jgi:sterol 14alpha-demethylase